MLNNDKSYGQDDASFIAAGGELGIRRLVEDFYQAMNDLPEAKKIRDMHADDLEESIDKLARFLCGWLGGPKLYSEKYGSIRIPVAHRHLKIGIDERNAWLACMKVALGKQADYPQAFKEYLIEQLFVPAERSRNQ